MRILNTVMLAACLTAGGCASQPAGDIGPTTSTTRDESPERMRARVHTELAASYYELGNLAIALEEVKEALRADANYGPANNVAGLVYARLKEDQLAEESFLRALRINPADPDANNNYGLFLCDRKQEPEAIKRFLTAVRNPLYATPERSWVNAGVCARRSGDIGSAVEYFQQALKLRPNQSQALYQLADIAYARADYGGAKMYLNRLTQAAVLSAEMLWLGVRTERRLGDRAAEASYALQLRNRFPNSREAQALRLGQYE